MSAWLTPEDIEAAKAIGRRRKPISDEQKAVLRETFGPLVAQLRERRLPQKRKAVA